MKLSFVIPCYGSENTITNVIGEIIQVMQQKPEYEYEIITVNDCSPDHVLDVLIKLAEDNQKLKVIDCAKNMGKHAALMAGYSYAEGEIIVSLDDDYQCPVDKLWDLLEPLDRGKDVVVARYSHKKQSALKNMGSRLNDFMTRKLIGKPKGFQLSNFFAMRRYVCEEMLKYQNAYPYIDGLYLRTTKYLENVSMEERERLEGKTNFNLRRSISLFVNGFTAFSIWPLRIATYLGAVFAVLGLIAAVFIVINKLCNPEVLAGYSSTMAVIICIGGMLMLMLGIIGEYIGRIYISLNNSPQYVIRRLINVDTSEKE